MFARRVLIGLCLATVLGCSGLTTLVVNNRTGEKVTVKLVSIEKYKGKASQDETALSLEPGHRGDAVKWFYDPPESIDVDATWATGALKKTLRAGDYPPGMVRGSSGLGEYVMDLEKDKVRIRPPTGWEKVLRRPETIYIPAGGLLCVGGTLFFIVWLVRKKQRDTIQT